MNSDDELEEVLMGYGTGAVKHEASMDRLGKLKPAWTEADRRLILFVTRCEVQRTVRARPLSEWRQYVQAQRRG